MGGGGEERYHCPGRLGIAHVYGKTDADAVFGMIYAQCEDDFNRVETNYLNAVGRLAEARAKARYIRICA